MRQKGRGKGKGKGGKRKAGVLVVVAGRQGGKNKGYKA